MTDEHLENEKRLLAMDKKIQELRRKHGLLSGSLSPGCTNVYLSHLLGHPVRQIILLFVQWENIPSFYSGKKNPTVIIAGC